jgi:hypothetical protein
VATIFVDHFSRLSYTNLQKSTSAEETIEGKEAFERFANAHGIRVEHYHAGNGIFASQWTTGVVHNYSLTTDSFDLKECQVHPPPQAPVNTILQTMCNTILSAPQRAGVGRTMTTILSAAQRAGVGRTTRPSSWLKVAQDLMPPSEGAWEAQDLMLPSEGAWEARPIQLESDPQLETVNGEATMADPEGDPFLKVPPKPPDRQRHSLHEFLTQTEETIPSIHPLTASKAAADPVKRFLAKAANDLRE